MFVAGVRKVDLCAPSLFVVECVVIGVCYMCVVVMIML